MKRVTTIFIFAILVLAFVVPVSATAVQTIPTFSIASVIKDQSVTIQTANFPANDKFTVTMGDFGTQGIGGVAVGTTDSGNGGSFKVTYNIPSTLVGSERIAIRLQSPTSGFFAYNWFWNNPATASSTASPIAGSSGFPTFSVISVVKDQSATILTKNLPPNDTFTVTMGKMGTKGIDGTVVGSTQSGSGGALTETYTIPAALAGQNQIAIRMQSPTTGFFAYNWFFNNTASVTPPSSSTPTAVPSSTPLPTPSPTPTTTPSGSTNFPSFSIVSVIKDQSVTIKGLNFPANDTFDVLMGAFGTQGIDGIDVGSTNTGAGGNLSATYNIPAALAGTTRIAIRLQSPTSGFFAYNWFFNTTTP